jgi:hypothetical protein
MDFYDGGARRAFAKEKEMVTMNSDCEMTQHLMRINVGDQRLREKQNILLVGSCMDRFPDIVQETCEKNSSHFVLHVCLEETHMNQAGFKIGSIVKYSDIKRVSTLTVDGSPHCVQLHYLVEDIKRHFAPNIEIAHYVQEEGKVFEVSADAVKRSRHLSKIQKMLDG